MISIIVPKHLQQKFIRNPTILVVYWLTANSVRVRAPIVELIIDGFSDCFQGNEAFTNFCLQLGLLDKHGLIFPSEENLMYFAEHIVPGLEACLQVRSTAIYMEFAVGPLTKAYLIL